MNGNRIFHIVLTLAAGAAALAPPPAAAIAHGECCSSVNGVCISVCRRDSCTGNGDCKLAKAASSATSDTPGIDDALRSLEGSDRDELRRLLAANDARKGFQSDGTVTFFVDGVGMSPEAKNRWIKAQLVDSSLPVRSAGSGSGPGVAHIKVFAGDPGWSPELASYLLVCKQRARRIDEIRLRDRDGDTIALKRVRIVSGPTSGVSSEITLEWDSIAD
ncbi:MAG TPA: hypothetical protein VGV61_16290 [Thermoanaerobaculia bacterium]|jgi:hypothetical protein|nr:hypothetical protein [Thermoanaerobaculia bacterium]